MDDLTYRTPRKIPCYAYLFIAISAAAFGVERAMTAPGPKRTARSKINTPPPPELLERVLVIHRRLCGIFGCPHPYFRVMDPVSELVGSLLSHRTKNRESGTALRALQAAYPDWRMLIEAPAAEVESHIAAVTFPEVKAPVIQGALRFVLEERGELSLDFLAELTSPEALAWLRRIKGVGPKTAAATLAFSSLRMRALPVDSHHYRVARRLALIPPTVAEGPSHERLEALLPSSWDAQAVYDHHEVMMLHGQQVCFWRRPACSKCVLAELCPSAGTAGGEL